MPFSRESFIVIYCTFPDSGTAEKVASILLNQKQIACANMIPGLESHYWWEGKIQKDREVLLMLKTQNKCFQEVEAVIKKNHPYQVPEIIALPVLQGNAPYLSWIQECVKDSHV